MGQDNVYRFQSRGAAFANTPHQDTNQPSTIPKNIGIIGDQLQIQHKESKMTQGSYSKKDSTSHNLPAPQTQNITAYVPQSAVAARSDGFDAPGDKAVDSD